MDKLPDGFFGEWDLPDRFANAVIIWVRDGHPGCGGIGFFRRLLRIYVIDIYVD